MNSMKQSSSRAGAKKIAVLLALYNGAQFIEKQLESLLAQTMHIDYVLIGDDGSTDNGVEIVTQFIKDNGLGDEWRVIVNQSNRGHAGNFINLCSIVDAEYVFFCDQDDIWMPDKVESMVNIMENNDGIQLLYADVINTLDPERGSPMEVDAYFDKTVFKVPFSAENYFYKGLGCATCLRGLFVKQMLPYWTEGWEHDMFFWACAVMMGSGYKYNYPVIWRRLHNNNVSMTGQKTLEKRIMQVEQSLARPKQLKKLIADKQIIDAKIIDFVNGYEKALRHRVKALKKRNLLIALYNLIFGAKYYLHKKKGAILDIVLIIFRRYPLK